MYKNYGKTVSDALVEFCKQHNIDDAVLIGISEGLHLYIVRAKMNMDHGYISEVENAAIRGLTETGRGLLVEDLRQKHKK